MYKLFLISILVILLGGCGNAPPCPDDCHTFTVTDRLGNKIQIEECTVYTYKSLRDLPDIPDETEE